MFERREQVKYPLVLQGLSLVLVRLDRVTAGQGENCARLERVSNVGPKAEKDSFMRKLEPLRRENASMNGKTAPLSRPKHPVGSSFSSGTREKVEDSKTVFVSRQDAWTDDAAFPTTLSRRCCRR